VTHLKKLLLFCSFLLLTPRMLRAQNLATNIKVQAMDMASAVMNNDFNTFVKYMHPGIIGFAGGERMMKAKMDSAASAMKRFKVSFKKCSVGHPGEIIRHQDLLQSVYPQTTVMTTPMGELTVETSIIALSKDNGTSWWFIDTNVYRLDKLKNLIPELSPRLLIPPRKKPQLVRPGMTGKP